jgi:F420-non-reducing hydrogenase iron-sulfur subunit
MCSGRVDLDFIFKAFANGQDGVFIGGCKLNECNYATHGNYDALSNTYIAKRIMTHLGINPDRLRVEFMSGADAQLFTEVIDNFTKQIGKIGLLGEGEGLKKDELQFRIKATRKLIPYMRLVERERLRVPVKSPKAYKEFFESSETNELFDRIFAEKFALSQILLILKDKTMSIAAISEKLGLNPSDVFRYMNNSSNHGMVSYDVENKGYTLINV